MNYARIVVLVLVLLLFPLGYLKGCSDEKGRYDSFKAQVADIGKAQEQQTLARIAHDHLLKEQADEDHKAAISRLNARHAAALERMRADASSFVVPPAPGAPASSQGGEDIACFDRGLLNRELEGLLQRHAERLSGIAAEGESVAAGLAACAAWALKEADQPR